MKRRALVPLALLSMAVSARQNTQAAYGIMFTAKEAKQHALELAQKKGWNGAKVIPPPVVPNLIDIRWLN